MQTHGFRELHGSIGVEKEGIKSQKNKKKAKKRKKKKRVGGVLPSGGYEGNGFPPAAICCTRSLSSSARPPGHPFPGWICFETWHWAEGEGLGGDGVYGGGGERGVLLGCREERPAVTRCASTSGRTGEGEGAP